MYIKKLKLKNYRNYEEVEVDFDKKINIIYGDNAVGKTNLLESIYMCSTSKSHRNVKENDIINFNKEEAHIKLIYVKDREEKNKTIDIQLNKDSKKGIAKNGIKVEKISDFLGELNVILFSPEDLNIIKDGPQVRRKFLNVEISQIDKIYVSLIQNYNKILNQRNALLKDIHKEVGNNKDYLISMLDTYDEQISKYGMEVIKKRKENIKKIAEKIINIHLLISDKKEKLIVDYENDILEKDSEKEISENYNYFLDKYLKKIKDAREIDIKNQYTMIGPHRDDISFFIDEKDIRKFGSQGQKKTAGISLKLSELDILKEKINETPVLLLDDVFSELDESRQKLLVKNIVDIQTIITCTGIKKNVFDLLKPEKVLKVSDNKIIEKG